MRVMIFEDDDSNWIRGLKEKLSGDIEMTVTDEISASHDYDILVSGVPDKEHIEHRPSLKALIIPWAGLPLKTRELMRDYPDITVHNLHHNAVPVAEKAVALMMTAAHRIGQVDRCLREGDWSPRYMPRESYTLLTGKNAVVLGYGRIGQEIAKRCRGLGMNVVGVKKHVEKESDVFAQIVPIDRFRELLPDAHVLIISLPLTDETKGLIRDDELQLLPRKAVLVNIARGPIVDEEALFNALQERRICAALDVWYNYPREKEKRSCTFPSEMPFHKLDNLVLTPHMAEHSDGTEEQLRIHLADLLNKAAKGEEIPNRIDLDRGY